MEINGVEYTGPVVRVEVIGGCEADAIALAEHHMGGESAWSTAHPGYVEVVFERANLS